MPSLLSLSVVQVIRDGVLHRLPATFLVKDDVVRLRYGELAPARIRLLPVEPKPGQPPEAAVELEAGQCLHPSLLPARPWSIYHAPTYDFVCLETPLPQKLAAMLKTQRPTPVMENQRNYLYRVIVDRGMWVLLALSVLVNALRTGLLPGCVEDRGVRPTNRPRCVLTTPPTGRAGRAVGRGCAAARATGPTCSSCCRRRCCCRCCR